MSPFAQIYAPVFTSNNASAVWTATALRAAIARRVPDATAEEAEYIARHFEATVGIRMLRGTAFA